VRSGGHSQRPRSMYKPYSHSIGSSRTPSPCCCRSNSSSSSSSNPETSSNSWTDERVLFLPSGDVISMSSRKRNKELWPELCFTKEEAVEQQLKVNGSTEAAALLMAVVHLAHMQA
jgi:hypothetical protein